MRAVIYDAIGATPQVREVPEPVAPEGGVVVRVHATGLCRSDWHAWAGHDEITLPHVPGHELAGVVASVGPGVQRWSVGDRVTVPFACGCGRCEWCRRGEAQVCPDQQQPGFTYWGSFAEYVAVDAARVYPVPDRVGFAEAACLPMNYLTMSFGLQTRGELWPGETVLVHGAAGGIGSATVQLCRAIGARVIAVVSSPQKAEFVRSLGASEVVAVEGFKDTVLGLTDRAGVDVVVDPVGGDRFTDSLRCLAPLGRLLVVGFTAGEIPTVKVNRLLLNNIDVRGVGWGAYADRNPDAYREEWRKLLPLLENGAIGPPISEIVPLDGVRSAVERLSDRAVLGKVVLAIGSETSARR